MYGLYLTMGLRLTRSRPDLKKKMIIRPQLVNNKKRDTNNEIMSR